MADMVNNERLHNLILGFVDRDKLIAAECYCVTCLAFSREWTDRKSIIWGKNVTGHALFMDLGIFWNVILVILIFLTPTF